MIIKLSFEEKIETFEKNKDKSQLITTADNKTCELKSRLCKI